MHTVKPLPFDPSKLRGLSERLMVSHHENNYDGAVKDLNRTEEELARVTKDTPPLLVAALKERELDMYEHSYALDYGAAAAKYVDVFFQNIQWDEVNRRLENAQSRAA